MNTKNRWPSRLCHCKIKALSRGKKMLPSTKKFLIKTHEAFDELGYRVKSGNIDFEVLERSAVKTLNHSKELEDSLNCMWVYNFVYKKIIKIQKLINKFPSFWNGLKYQGNELINLLEKDDEAEGIYYVTNAIFDDKKEIGVFGQCFYSEESIGFLLEMKHKKYFINSSDQPEYYLRNSKMSSTKMILEDKNEKKICDIVLSKDSQIFLENNKSKYDIIAYEDFMGVYFKEYTNSLADDDEIDPKKMVCLIEWDIIDEKSELGLTRLELYNEEADIEILLLFAASCFLVFSNYMKALKHAAVPNSLSSWARR